MKLLWTLVKIVLVLALVIPASIIALGLTLGLFGMLFGLAVVALRIAVFALLAYGGFRLVAWMLRGRDRAPTPEPVKQLPPADPYYNAAMRELDRELGTR
jgi:hypothetical protein